MSYKILALPEFRKNLKKLAKKYPSLKTELATLFDKLEKNPFIGNSLGKNVYKIRVAIASKGKGKSGGARVISYVQIDYQTIILLSIYNKSDIDSISDKEVQYLLRKYGL